MPQNLTQSLRDLARSEPFMQMLDATARAGETAQDLAGKAVDAGKRTLQTLRVPFGAGRIVDDQPQTITVPAKAVKFVDDPDPVADLLRRTPAPNAVRAQLRDVFDQSTDADELAEKLKLFRIPDHYKNRLWELKSGSAPQANAPTGKTIRVPIGALKVVDDPRQTITIPAKAFKFDEAPQRPLRVPARAGRIVDDPPKTLSVPVGALRVVDDQPDTITVPADQFKFDDTPDFQSTNQKDAGGNAVVSGLSKTWSLLNTPLMPWIAEAAHALANKLDVPRLDHPIDPRAAFGAGAVGALGDLAAGFTSPLGIILTLAGAGPEGAAARRIPSLKWILELPQVRLLQRAAQASGGAAFAAHGAERVLDAPTLGEQAQGVAEIASGALGASSAMRSGRPASARRAPSADETAVAWGKTRGIPIDAGTATGNPAIKGAQFMTDRTLAGSVVAKSANRATADALTRVGGELADSARGAAITPEQAGQGIRDALTSRIQAHSDLADSAYDKLRALEQEPTNRMDIPLPKNAPVDQVREVVRNNVRRIVHELDAEPFNQRRLQPTQYGGSLEHVPGTGGAGAPVFDDIVANLDGSYRPTRAAVQEQLEEYLGGGKETAVVKAALAVAKERAFGGGAPGGPPGAYDMPTRLEGARQTSQEMGFPVNVGTAKAMLKPLYAQMTRQMPITQQQANPGLKAIQNILEGPDWAPLSQVDRDLSTIKSLARSHGGLAKAAVARLDAVVRETAANHGPHVMQTLEQGRGATVAKYAASEVLEALREEPVQVFRQATAPKDSGITLLRAVKEQAPQTMPQIARAKLDELLAIATDEGGFDHTDKLYAEWSKLGTETKRLLFPQPGQAPMLDHFFLLAKRLNQNVNPSGSGPAVMRLFEGGAAIANPVGFVVAQVGSAGLSKLLHSRAGVNALTRVLSMQVKSPTPAMLNSAARTAGWAEVVTAARAVGVPLTVPQAASSTPSEERR